MIIIKYTRSSIKITGHAMFAPKWNDIVCAAVSAIIFGAIKWFDPKDVKITQNRKDNSIKLVLKKCSKQNIQLLDLIVTQLKPITKKYSQYVKISKGI